MTTFRAGMKVVCINDKFESWSPGEHILPKKASIYTVRDVIPDFTFRVGKSPALRLVEVVNPVCHWTDGDITEIAFGSKRFRPVVERETDISIFTAMLNPSTRKVEA